MADVFADLNQIQSTKVFNEKIKVGHFKSSVVSTPMADAKDRRPQEDVKPSSKAITSKMNTRN